MNREIMQQALDALKNGKRVRSGEGGTKYQPTLENSAIAALEAKLAKPEQDHGFDRTASHMAGEYVDTAKPKQEPVRWFQQFGDAPPRKEWVGLTNDEIDECLCATTQQTAQKIEAKLKEKNT